MVDDPRPARPHRRGRRAAPGPAVRVCLDLDASSAALGGRVHLGPRRSPRALGRRRRAAGPRGRRGARLPAGRADGLRGPGRRGCSDRPARTRCAAAAVRGDAGALGPPSWPSGGRRWWPPSARSPTWSSSTAAAPGSLETHRRRGGVTEVAAGSGLYGPALFDGYDAFRARPGGLLRARVVRRPAPGIVTVSGGGWVASGPAGTRPAARAGLPGGPAAARRRAPARCRPRCTGPRPAARCGRRPGLVPARQGRRAVRARRRAAPGQGDAVVETVPTYRGEGMTFAVTTPNDVATAGASPSTAPTPPRLAAFWALALGYEPAPPPTGWTTWEDLAARPRRPRGGVGRRRDDPRPVRRPAEHQLPAGARRARR